MVLEIDQIPLKGLPMRLKPFFRLSNREFLGENVKKPVNGVSDVK